MDSTKQAVSVGAAAVDVSPERIGFPRVWLGGYLPTRYAVQQADPIEARAVAVESAGCAAIMVTIDTCLLSPLVAGAWARRISAATGVDAGNVFVITTHTHSGPDLAYLFGGVPPSYFLKVRRGALRAAREAWARRRRAELFVGAATHELGIPRRKPQGQTETESEAVVLQWRAGSEVIATLINLGCHGVVLPRKSPMLSSDLPGALCCGADAEFGGVSLFLPRAQGDVNPDLPGRDAYEQDGDMDELVRLAWQGFRTVARAVKKSVPVESSPVEVVHRELEVSIRNPLAAGFELPIWLGRLPEKPGVATIPVREFRIGGVRGLAVPGEILTCLGKRWLERLGSPSILISYCGGYRGYLMTGETWRRGGYEPKVSPGPVDPDALWAESFLSRKDFRRPLFRERGVSENLPESFNMGRRAGRGSAAGRPHCDTQNHNLVSPNVFPGEKHKKPTVGAFAEEDILAGNGVE